jgi:hypothetical protein
MSAFRVSIRDPNPEAEWICNCTTANTYLTFTSDYTLFGRGISHGLKSSAITRAVERKSTKTKTYDHLVKHRI